MSLHAGMRNRQHNLFPMIYCAHLHTNHLLSTMLNHTHRWTCLYKATLSQSDNIRVDEFPHDRHDLTIKLGILAQRDPGQRWDRTRHSLQLATEEDTQGSIRVPHGLIVDHLRIPDFNFDEKEGLQFHFQDLPFGTGKTGHDCQLLVQVPVVRESGYYDRNVMPTLLLLSFLAISCLVRNFVVDVTSIQAMLTIAFVEVGIRLSIDSRLPSVGYPVKLQTLMTECFWMLCTLIFQSNVVFFLLKQCNWNIMITNIVDIFAAVSATVFTLRIAYRYYYIRS
jgi:hypothetical protein